MTKAVRKVRNRKVPSTIKSSVEVPLHGRFALCNPNRGALNLQTLNTKWRQTHLESEASRRDDAGVLRVELDCPRGSRVTSKGLHNLAIHKPRDFHGVISMCGREHFPRACVGHTKGTHGHRQEGGVG